MPERGIAAVFVSSQLRLGAPHPLFLEDSHDRLCFCFRDALAFLALSSPAVAHSSIHAYNLAYIPSLEFMMLYLVVSRPCTSLIFLPT
jgi:hypothetical protein